MSGEGWGERGGEGGGAGRGNCAKPTTDLA